MDNNNDFDFSRNDKFYTLTIPRYSVYDDVVLYEFHLKDLVTNKQYAQFFRFKDLKEINDSLTVLKLELPEFPKTHFWKKTNKHPELIEGRKVKLEYFFQIILNDPLTRGHSEVKKLIKKMKYSTRNSHRFSSPPGRSALTETTRSHSLSKMGKRKVDIEQLKKKNFVSKKEETKPKN